MEPVLELLKDWKGEIEINSRCYNNIGLAESDCKSISADTHIKLYSAKKNASQRTTQSVTDSSDSSEITITVKKYMTEKASPGFDFMAKWNNDNPMPLRTMTGTVVKETRGMVYMKLHGRAEAVVRCMRCGRLLTNPVSKLYGIGPECMSKLGFVRVDIEDVDTIKKKLVDVIWEGWIIKSAIIEKEETNGENN